MLLRKLKDLCRYVGCEDICALNKTVYNDTECGASISVLLFNNKWLHNGQDGWKEIRVIKGFQFHTIIEGSEAELSTPPFMFPVHSHEVTAALNQLEDEAQLLWKEAQENA